MSQKSSKFWTFFALPASLLILASAYYLRVASVRRAIDARTPIARQLLGRFVPESDAAEDEREAARSGGPSAASASKSGSSAGQARPVETPAVATPPPGPPVFDLQKLARDRSLWPKKVALRKPTNFPAVVDGKVVGNIIAPAGTEANLKAIKDGKVGLEYEGGGTWLAVEDTDLATRVPLQ